MNALKRAIREAVRSAGFEVIPHWRSRQFGYDQHVKMLFERLGINFVIDVGANVGQFGTSIKRDVGYRGPIVSFEPQHDVAECLRVTAANDGDWQVFELALGASSSCRELNVCAATTFSSFKTPDPKGAFAPSQVVTRRDLVEVRRLDSFEFPPAARIYLKIDTQGFDVEVVKGATGMLDRVVGVQTEVAFIPLYKDEPGWQQSIATFQQLGFVVSGFFPVSHDRTGRLVTADCVLVRE